MRFEMTTFIVSYLRVAMLNHVITLTAMVNPLGSSTALCIVVRMKMIELAHGVGA